MKVNKILARKIQMEMPFDAFSAAGRKYVVETYIQSMNLKWKNSVSQCDDVKLIVLICELLEGAGCLRANAKFAINAYMELIDSGKTPSSMPSIRWVREIACGI